MKKPMTFQQIEKLIRVHPAPKPKSNIRREVREDGVVVLTFDRPDSAANILDLATLDELEKHIDRLARAGTAAGVVFAGGKSSIFVAGADIRSLASARGARLRSFIEKGQRIFQKIAGLPMPTAAAIHGACLGGGLELALACDWRVASPERATKIGLPETQLGIIPAWGGCTRLPRLIGLPKALGLILTGRQLPAEAARRKGIVDGLAPRERLVDRAVQLMKPKRRRRSRWLTNNGITAAVLGKISRRKVLEKTRGNYPAVEAAIDVVCRSVTSSIAGSLIRERETVLALAETSETANLIRIFLLQENAKKFRFSGVDKPREIGRAAVIGAGVMGAGIAQWLSARQVPVVLQDLDEERVAAGMAAVARLYDGAVKRRLFTGREARLRMDRVSPSAAPAPLTSADLVIEAAVEDLEIKKRIFGDLCSRTRPDAILATNTSALPISDLARAEGVTHSERIIGLHFFNPVHGMKLVEVVVTDATSGETVETALRFVRRIGKLPVVVRDSPGFVVNRVLMPYLLEACRLFERGGDPGEIDGAMLDFGMPMGPLRLLDEVGLDVAGHVARTMEAAFPGRFVLPGVLGDLADRGHLGRKSKRGFYLYDRPAPAVNPAAGEAQKPGASLPMEREEIAERLALLMANEGFRILEDGVARDSDDVDFAMILGTGFAPFRGGPMTWAKTVGLGRIRERLRALSETDGALFTPSHLLSGAADLKECRKILRDKAATAALPSEPQSTGSSPRPDPVHSQT